MANKHAALVIGICSHGLSVIRALHSEGITVFAIEKNTDIPGVMTNAIAQLFKVKDFSAAELMSSLPEIRQSLSEWDEVVLFATNDNHVKFIAEHYPQLESYFKVSWARERATVLQLLDKRNLERFSNLAGLNYPKSCVLNQSKEHDMTLQTFRYPVIIKPAKPLSSFKTQIANNADEVQTLITKFEADLPFIAQEYIEGNDQALFFCALVVHNGAIIQSMVGQKISSFPPARGQTTIARTTESKQIEDLTAQFFNQFTLSGPVSLELKKAPDNTYWVIEPTVGRTDFWSELCIKAGFNQPYQEYLIALDKPVPPMRPYLPVIWFDCERAPLSYLKICWTQKTLWPYGRQNAFTYFSIKDVKPFFAACVVLVKRLLFK